MNLFCILREEEIKYLEFIKEVTDDVIARGISSNRVINSCFEYHVKKHKHELNEAKMRDLLSTLRKDIGIPDADQSRLPITYPAPKFFNVFTLISLL